ATFVEHFLDRNRYFAFEARRLLMRIAHPVGPGGGTREGPFFLGDHETVFVRRTFGGKIDVEMVNRWGILKSRRLNVRPEYLDQLVFHVLVVLQLLPRNSGNG